MHIGFITGDLTTGHGWARYSLSLITALRACGVRVTVVASRNSPSDFEYPVYPILPNLTPAESWTLPKLALKIPDARQRLADCDLIHTTVEPFAPLGSWIAGKRPHIISGVGTYTALPILRRWPVGALYRRTFLGAAAMVCISHYTERRLLQAVPGVRSHVVVLGVDTQKVNQELAQVQPLEKRGLTVVALGAVKPRKGTLELVRAMAVVCQQIPDAQCVIVGRTDSDSAYTERIQAEIETLGLQNNVQMTGFITDPLGPARWLKTADVFVLPSLNEGWRFEGFGLVHLEASAAGLPVIGTRDCGSEDAIDDGVTGLLVSQQNIAEELPAAILTLLRDPEKRQQMGAAGREKAMHRTWERVATQMRDIYEQILGTSQRAGI